MKKTSLLGLLALCGTISAHAEMTTAETETVPVIDGATVTRVTSVNDLAPGDKILIRVHSCLYADDPYLAVNSSNKAVGQTWDAITDKSTAVFTLEGGAVTYNKFALPSPYVAKEYDDFGYKIKYGNSYVPFGTGALATTGNLLRLIKVTDIPGTPSNVTTNTFAAESNANGFFMWQNATNNLNFFFQDSATDPTMMRGQISASTPASSALYYNGLNNGNSNADSWAVKRLTPFCRIYRVVYDNQTNTTHNAATGNTAGGWYTIKCNQPGNTSHTNALNNYIANMDEEHYQTTTTSNCYALRWNRSADSNYVKGPGDDGYEQETKKAKKFIWIKNTSAGATTYNFRSINGHWVQKNSCSARVPGGNNDTDTNVPVGAGASGSGNNIGKWSVFGPQTSSGGNANFCLVGGGTNTTFYYDIEPADVSDYEIYSVEISDLVNGSRTNLDPSITYTGTNNCGIDKVYNGGTYFFSKNTVPAAGDFQVNYTDTYSDPALSSTVTIDETAKAIRVSIHSKLDQLTGEGWYTIKCIRAQEASIRNTYFANLAEEYDQDNSSYSYALYFDKEGTASAIEKLVHIKPSATAGSYQYQAINGHWLNGNGVSQRAAVDLEFSNYGTGYLGNIADYTPVAEGSTYVSGQQNRAPYGRYEITPASVAGYDIYTVNIIGGFNSDSYASADTYVTLKDGVTCASSSITKIYNGGYFFFDKDTEVSVDDFVYQEINGGTPVVTIEEIDGVKTIKVDYEAITAQAEMLMAEADTYGGNGLNQYVFTGIDELREKYNAYVALDEDAEGRDAAKADLIRAYNAATYVANPVERGKFIRIIASQDETSCFVDNGSGFGFAADADHNSPAGIFYYSPEGYLIGYQEGYAVKHTGQYSKFDTRCTATEHANISNNAGVVSFTGNDSRFLGHYLVATTKGSHTRGLYRVANGSMGAYTIPTNLSEIPLEHYKNMSYTVEYVNALPVDIHADGYGAVVCPLALEVPSDVTAYVAKVDGNKMSFDAVSVIPAGAHALIKAEGQQQSVTLPLATSEDVATAYDNLKGHHLTRIVTPAEGNSIYSKVNPNAAAATDAEEALGAKLYRLDANDDGQVIVPAGSFAVEMATPKDNPESITVDPVGTEVTLGISNIQTLEHSNTIYDLQGRKLAAPARGINIIGGRKVLVK